jgi:hypothetical protein
MWAGNFAKLKAIRRDAYDRIVGLALEDLAVDGCIAKAPAARLPDTAPRTGVTRLQAESGDPGP